MEEYVIVHVYDIIYLYNITIQQLDLTCKKVADGGAAGR